MEAVGGTEVCVPLLVRDKGIERRGLPVEDKPADGILNLKAAGSQPRIVIETPYTP